MISSNLRPGCFEVGRYWITEMIITLRVSVYVLIFLLTAIPAFAREDAKQLYEKGLKLEEKLKSSEVLQTRQSEWKTVIEAFRRVYYTYPSSSYCDNALFHVGALYGEMGARFNDSLYHRRAIGSYQFLIEQYDSSSLVEDAMLESIRIMRNELREEKDALEMEAKLLKRSPKMAAELARSRKAASLQPAVLKGLRHYTGTDYTRIVLDFDRETPFKRNLLSDPDRLYFDFENTTAAHELLKQNITVDDGLIKQIRIGQNQERKARVVIDLKSIENYEVFPLYHPYRVVVDVQGKKSQQTPAAVAAPPLEMPTTELPLESPEMAKANASGNYSLARQLGLKVSRIVVDPGHGGQDPGAMHNGLREKDITLDVSLRLKSILEQTYGFEVLMTRSDDRFIPLEERAAFANRSGADLFVSVHVNSSRNKKARGIETYYLNFATSPEAMEVAARENAIAEKNMAELQKLTAAIALNSKIEESRDLANLIQANLISSLRKQYSVSNLGVKQAPFYVLIGAQMPSILAEISFLSHQTEAEWLSHNSYKQSVAQGIATGVKNYIETLAETKLTRNLTGVPKAR